MQATLHTKVHGVVAEAVRRMLMGQFDSMTDEMIQSYVEPIFDLANAMAVAEGNKEVVITGLLLGLTKDEVVAMITYLNSEAETNRTVTSLSIRREVFRAR